MQLPDCGDENTTSGHCRDHEERPPPKSVPRVRGVRGSAAFTRASLARAVSHTSDITFAGKRNVVAASDLVRFVQGGNINKIEIFASKEFWTTWCQNRKVAVEQLFVLEKTE
jgi:hypothetical protein